jgi:glutathione peroxidase
MLIRLIYVLTIVALVALVLAMPSSAAESPCPSVLDQKLANLQDEPVSLCQFSGKVLLLVNTASECGYTPQYEGLEKLYRRYHDRGFVVLGFPANDFGGQEPGSNKDIAQFCRLNYGVTFPMFAKVDVNGDKTAPLYKWLKKEQPGILGSEAIKWNFTKFLIDRKGNVVARFAPKDPPESLQDDIEKLL